MNTDWFPDQKKQRAQRPKIRWGHIVVIIVLVLLALLAGWVLFVAMLVWFVRHGQMI